MGCSSRIARWLLAIRVMALVPFVAAKGSCVPHDVSECYASGTCSLRDRAFLFDRTCCANAKENNRILTDSPDVSRASNCYYGNLTLKSYRPWEVGTRTIDNQTFTVDLFRHRGNLSSSSQQLLMNGMQVSFHQDAFRTDETNPINCECPISFNAPSKEQSISGKELSVAHTSTRSPSYWLMYGIGALLEFTILPGTLSFVLSLNEQTDSFQAQDNASLSSRYRSFEYVQPHLATQYLENMSNETLAILSEDRLNDYFQSQTLVRLLLQLSQSILKLIAYSSGSELRTAHGLAVTVLRKESGAMLSSNSELSYYWEQYRMKKLCRLI